MESQHPELTLYGSQKECSRTNTVLLLISEVSTGAVSLAKTSIYLSPDKEVRSKSPSLVFHHTKKLHIIVPD